MNLFFRSLFVAIVFAPLAAWADGSSASATLSETSTEPGQSVEYRIDVVGARGGQAPKAPQADGLTITAAGRSTSMQMTGSMGGGMEVISTTSYTFNVEAAHAGRFVIPGQQIDTGSGTVRVEPVTLTVVNGGGGGGAGTDPDRSIFAQLELGKTSAYVGEAIPVEVRAFFGMKVVPVNIDPNVTLNGEGFTTQKFAQPKQDVQTVDGVKYRVVTYRSAVAGAKTGSLPITLADLNAVVRVPRTQSQRRQAFSNPFDDDPFFRDPFGAFNETVPKQIKLRADPQTLEIKPLPPGAPADFTGGIGHFTMEADAEPRKAQAGDPVTAHIHLSGQGNFDRVGAPVISDDKGLHLYPANAQFKADDLIGLSGTKTFEQAIVSQTGRQSLPAYHLSFLDPDEGSYVSLKTAPLAAKIEGPSTPPVTPTPNPAFAPVAVATPSPAPAPAQKPRDILYIRSDAGPSARFTPVYRQRSFWLIQGVIAAALAGFGGLAWGRTSARKDVARRAAESQRRQSELLRALRTEGTARRDFYSAAARLAQLKAGAATGRPGEHLTVAEVCAAQRAGAPMAASVEQIFHRHDELAYSGGAVAQEPVPAEERRTVLETLETLGR